MGAKDLIADSRLAFLNQENETALNLARRAIALEPRNPDAYKCAGNACMSLARYDEAIKNYSQAVKCDGANGNRYYDLGFAQATADQTVNAMNSFARAEELGCVPENLVQLYNVLGIICFDIGRYDDALVNLSKAEQLLGVDLDIMQRKAVIYGIKNDIRNGLHTANQIKMIAPSEYKGYQIAFKLLIQAKRLETAEKELQMADYLPCLKPMFTDSALERPDAFVCVDDWRAYCAINALKQLGLRVPEDVGITGGSNGGTSTLVPIAVSGLNCRLEEICSKAVWLLLETINGRIDGGVTMQIRPHFIDGPTIRTENQIEK